MVNEFLVALVNSVLGVGKATSKGNQAYVCPFHTSNPPGKKNFEINFTENEKGENKWACWGCSKSGKTIYSLFKNMGLSPEIISNLNTIIKKKNYISSPTVFVATPQLKLPDEFKYLSSSDNVLAKQAKSYLKSRKFTKIDIEKYEMGYCDNGDYAKMIIVPSYDDKGNLNYFTGRSFEKKPFKRYRNPEVSRDIIPFELLINWDLPIIICEGVFDAMTIKRNAIPLLGKIIQPRLMKKIVTSSVKKIYIALDSDAINLSLKLAEQFMNAGKEVHLIELKEKDPNELGFDNFTKLIQSSVPLTNYSLMEKKLLL